MRIGVMPPYLVQGLDGATFIEWCQRVDAGPFDSIQMGERITFFNFDQMTSLAAAAAVTTRVRLVTGVTILPLHPTALFAKQAATIDVLSDGRLELGFGVGGRPHDYMAAERSMTRRHDSLDRQIDEIRRVWEGNPPFEAAEPVGPQPVRAGGPPLYCSAVGPKSLRRAARWADGFVGGMMTGLAVWNQVDKRSGMRAYDVDVLSGTVRRVRQAWTEAGRTERPNLIGHVWFALGDDAEEQMQAFGSAYFPPSSGGMRQPLAFSPTMAPVLSPARVHTALRNAAEAGYDEVAFLATSTDLDQLDRLAEVVDDHRR